MPGSGKFQNNHLLLQSKPWVLHQFMGHNASVTFPHFSDVAILTCMETAGWNEVSTRRIQIACGPRSHIIWSVKSLELVANPKCISYGFRNTIFPSLFIPVLYRAPIEKAPILQSVIGNNNRHGNSPRFEGKQMFLGFPPVLKEQHENMPCLNIFSTQKQKWGGEDSISPINGFKNYYQNNHTRPDQRVDIGIDSSETIPEIWKHRAGCYQWIFGMEKKKSWKDFGSIFLSGTSQSKKKMFLILENFLIFGNVDEFKS